MDVDRRRAEGVEEGGREDLHVAGEHDQVDLALEQLGTRRSASALAPGRPARGGTGGRGASTSSAQVRVVGDHRAISPPRCPFRQRQSRSSRQWSSRETITATRCAPRPLKRHSISNGAATSRREALLELARPVSPSAIEHHPHEERRPAVGRVLVDVDDVQTGFGEEARTVAISPGRSGQASSRRVVSASGAIRGSCPFPAAIAPQSQNPGTSRFLE